jgi:two-component system OmpR family response regulator
MSDKKDMLVFVIDDDSMQQELLKDYLGKSGKYTVKAFSNGEECLQNLSLNPSIIFLDYNLNSVKKNAKDGLTVLKEIKKSNPETEVVMFSGQEKIEIAVNTMTYGAFDYIVKSESAFLRADNVIKNILKRHKLQQENKMFKRLSITLGGLAAILIIGAIVAYALGYITDGQVGADI